MPRTTAQNAEIRAASQIHLLNTALAVFAEQGYGSASMRKIAHAASVSPGLLYHYFANKEALLQAVFDHCMETLNGSFEGMAPPQERRAYLAFLMRHLFKELQRDATFWRLFYNLRWQPAVMQQLGDQFRLWTHRLRNTFAMLLRENGSAEPQIDARLLYCFLEGAIQQYLLEPDDYPLDEVVEKMLKTLEL